MSRIFVRGVGERVTEEVLMGVVRRILLDSTDDLAWLQPGQTVLLKPAVNSPHPYPSTTHPLAVKAVADEILARGGKVVVGDQGGIGHVMHTPHGVTRGSTREMFQQTGIAGVLGSDVQLAAFEEGDWERDFYLFKDDDTEHWPDGFYLTDWVRKADHIINLPRLSTHSMAGVTLGFKNLVGLLREDSRLEFHTQGPFFDWMKRWAKSEDFKLDFPDKKDFFERMTEISLAVKDKLRLTLFVGTQAQVTFGPDKYTYRLFGERLASHVAKPDVGLIFASQDPVAAEALAIAYLAELYRALAPWHKKLLQKFLMRMNGMAKELGTYDVWDNPFIVHALKIGLGERKAELLGLDEFKDLSGQLKTRLK